MEYENPEKKPKNMKILQIMLFQRFYADNLFHYLSDLSPVCNIQWKDTGPNMCVIESTKLIKTAYKYI